jgi:RNA-splicing ligase RtcB
MPIEDPTLVFIGYGHIHATGLYDIACHEWRKLPTDEQTMATFKSHFHNAVKEQKLTMAAAGFHSANAATITSAAEKALKDEVAKLKADLKAALKKKIANARTPAPRRPAFNSNPNQPPPPTSYCWTHGTSMNLHHDSGTCERQAPGHQHDATEDNKMGGSTFVYGDAALPRRST